MIDFVHMVHEALFEVETQVLGLDFLSEATSRPDMIFKWHYEPRVTEIQSTLKQAYPDMTIPANTNVETYLRQIFQTGSRGGISPNTLPGVQDWFPLFDLLCIFDTTVSSLSAADQDKKDKTDLSYQRWKDQVRGATSNVPIQYTPISPHARILQSKIIQGASLGEMRIDKLADQNISFYAATEHLLETLTETESKILAGNRSIFPKKFEDFFDQSGKDIIYKILHDVNAIVTGSFSIDKKIDEIFGHSTSTRLTNISLSLYKLFTREVNIAVNTFLVPVDKTLEITPATSTTLATSAYDACVEVKDSVIQDVLKDSNLYEAFVGDSDTKQLVDYRPFLESYFKKYGHDVTSYYIIPTPALSSDIKFKVDIRSADDLTYDYSIKNLITAAKGDYTEAKNVYELFIDLGSHIKTKLPKDKLGGAVSIAKGLSFGVKNMGD